MDQIYEQALKYMEATVHGLDVPAPQPSRTIRMLASPR